MVWPQAASVPPGPYRAAVVLASRIPSWNPVTQSPDHAGSRSERLSAA